MTDVELDERVTALEENAGGGNTPNGHKLCFNVNIFSKAQSLFCIKEIENWKSLLFLHF